MGLIKATLSSVSSTFGDQFKEFIDCPEVDNNVIVQRGVVNHGNGNRKPSDGVISNGSTIAVPQGMAMMIVDNGQIVEFSAEPGTYTWNTSSEPSIFAGGLGGFFPTLGKRISYGGQPAKDQRVYYVNIKTIPGNTFGSSQPEPIYDPVYGSVEITYNGEYAIKVADPTILVQSVIGANPKDTLTYDDIFTNGGVNQLKSKFSQKVSEAIANIMLSNNISFNRIQGYKSQVTDEMNKILDEDWMQKYGIVVEDVSLRVNASESSKKIVQEMDAEIAKTTRMGQVFSQNPQGAMAAASAEAMKTAAGNENGAMMGFMGMNMATMQGNNMMGAMNAMQQPMQNPQQQAPQENATQNTAQTIVTPTENLNEQVSSATICPNCKAEVTGKFCSNCGTAL